MTTTARLLMLLSLLQTRRDWPGSLLASRLEISDRTVRRDIDRLRDMGYRIQARKGPDGGYRLAAGSDLPPLLFDDDQAVAVAIALQTSAAAGAEIGDAAIRALATIRQVMPSRIRHRLDTLEVTAVRRPGEAPLRSVSPDVLVALATAIRACETLRFDYAAQDAAEGDRDPTPPRRVEPVHLVTSQGRWYLVGWDVDRDDWRVYRADRIRPRTPNGRRFTPRTVPGGDVDAYVSAIFKGSDANEWACRGTVILDLPARRVLPFAGDGTVTVVDEERCALEAGSWSWESLAASFGRFEVAMEVVGPPELAAAFDALAARYRAAGTPRQARMV
ncbi:MAG: WYL domain-containing protein [Actinobacteria bacterium]|nr:WYL domain-containing protein [Actinomycetota bacterium]